MIGNGGLPTLVSRLLRLALALVFISGALAFASAQADGPSVNRPSAVITLQGIDSTQPSPTGNYRWLNAADQPYSAVYRTTYNYMQATVSDIRFEKALCPLT